MEDFFEYPLNQTKYEGHFNPLIYHEVRAPFRIARTPWRSSKSIVYSDPVKDTPTSNDSEVTTNNLDDLEPKHSLSGTLAEIATKLGEMIDKEPSPSSSVESLTNFSPLHKRHIPIGELHAREQEHIELKRAKAAEIKQAKIRAAKLSVPITPERIQLLLTLEKLAKLQGKQLGIPIPKVTKNTAMTYIYPPKKSDSDKSHEDTSLIDEIRYKELRRDIRRLEDLKPWHPKRFPPMIEVAVQPEEPKKELTPTPSPIQIPIKKIDNHVCSYCDRKFALERTLQLHLLQHCHKIPMAARRILDCSVLEHVPKAPLPVFSNLRFGTVKAINVHLAKRKNRRTEDQPLLRKSSHLSLHRRWKV